MTHAYPFPFACRVLAVSENTSNANCEDVLPGDCVEGTFNPTASCEGSQCIPLPPDEGACCVTGESALLTCQHTCHDYNVSASLSP